MCQSFCLSTCQIRKALQFADSQVPSSERIQFFLSVVQCVVLIQLVSVYRMGRDMAYDCWSCDLLCAASSPELYRINLEQVSLYQPHSFKQVSALLHTSINVNTHWFVGAIFNFPQHTVASAKCSFSKVISCP